MVRKPTSNSKISLQKKKKESNTQISMLKKRKENLKMSANENNLPLKPQKGLANLQKTDTNFLDIVLIYKN